MPQPLYELLRLSVANSQVSGQMSETRSLCPRCGLRVVQDRETGEWVCVYCGFISSNKPREQLTGKNISQGPDLTKRLQLLNQVSQQFGKAKVDELLDDDPVLKETWRLQLLDEVAKQFGTEKVEVILRNEPELKQQWNEFVESPLPQTIDLESARPDRLWYLAPMFFSVVGGIIAYVAVKDRDKSMAETCLGLGFLVFLGWFLFLLLL